MADQAASGGKVVQVEPLMEADPRRLGAYELLGRLGEGGQGIVYLGRGPAGERVAVKLLHPWLVADPAARERLQREVALAQRVARFCTAPVLHADLTGDRPYIVSEYVPGPSLRTLVRNEGPRRGAALERLAISTATALAAIHRAGILHRDFKPANVLMGPEGPVVIDFGVARSLDAPGVTAAGTTLGTPSYLAPEQLRGDEASSASDVFAWGVTMVYAATGAPAFGQDSVPVVMNRILHAEPDLGDMDGPMRELVAACLNKDPARRPTAEELVVRLTGGAVPQPAPGATPGPFGGFGAVAPPVPPPPSAPAAGGGPPSPGPARTPALDWRKGGGRAVLLIAAAAVGAVLVLGGGSVVVVKTRALLAGAQTTVSPTAVRESAAVIPAHPLPDQPSAPPPAAEVTPGAKRREISTSRPVRPGTPQATNAVRSQPTERPVTRTTSRPPKPTATPKTEPTREPSSRPTTHRPSRRPTTPRPSAPATTQPPTREPEPRTTTKPPTQAPATPNPHSPAGVCGAGYKVINSHALGDKATVYLLYSSAAGSNCVVTLSKHVIPGRIHMSATLEVQGGSAKSDSGSFTVYAGPVRLPAAKKCVRWGGSYGGTGWMSGWSHCG